MPKGIPAAGKRAAGGGRKPLGDAALVRRTVWLTREEVGRLEAFAAYDKCSFSEEVRRVFAAHFGRLADG